MDNKKLNAIVGYISRSVAAAALMIWGVFNISLFLMESGGEGSPFIGLAMCFVFGGMPLLLGSWLLYRNVASVTNKK